MNIKIVADLAQAFQISGVSVQPRRWPEKRPV
jgi:hypothetical protein